MYPNRSGFLRDGGVMAKTRLNRRFAVWSEDEGGFVEPALARRRRLAEEAKERKLAEVIDRSGSIGHLERAAKKLKWLDADDRVLYVPHWDLDKAEAAMKRAGVSGAVSNLCGSARRRVDGSGRGR
jgi:hypothetical protein